MSERRFACCCAWPRGRRGPASRQRFSSSIAQAPSGVMEKQVLKAGFRNVHVGKLGAGGGCDRRNLSDQRATSIGVNVGSRTVGGAHFPYSGERLQALEQVGSLIAEP